MAVFEDKKKKHPYVSRLYGLKFMKDLFETAQFHVIDSLDPKIEEKIFEIAQFNKKVKKANRGANYFVEAEKRPKDAEI